MKKICFLFALSCLSISAFTQTIFTYGTNTVSKDEFLRAYNKNKTAVENKEQSLREYLDLYSKFKLKVKAASELKLDTLPQLQQDLKNFREQVEEGYMNDEKGVNALVDEALKRSAKDIHVLHFFVAAQEVDTLNPFNAINEIYDNLKKGVTNYDEMVKTLNQKYATVKASDIGFITVFSLPYTYENVAYGLTPGTFSKPFRTKTGWHILKNVEERPAAGKWKVAQILFALPPNADAATIKSIEHKADSVYTLLMNGADFSETAKKYSQDRLSYQMGGEMHEFGTGKFSPAFEAEVFKLKNVGDISKPIFAADGYHIVKKLQQTPVITDRSDETNNYNVKQKVLQDSRVNSVKEKFTKDIIKKTGYKKNTLVKDEELYRYADSVKENSNPGKYPIDNKTIFTIGKKTYKGLDWLAFVRQFRQASETGKETNKEIYDKFVAASALDYYRKNLEYYNSDFKYQMQEFKEGNMLFEVMERNVWGKASNDSVGLKKYYDQHKKKYTWGASAEVVMFNCSTEKAAQEAIESLKEGKDWKIISEQSDGRIQGDSGRYEISQLQVPADVKLSEGTITTIVVNGVDNTASFSKVLKIFPENQQRSFDEARGLVINDYQNYLEEKWIEQLKIKYPVKINEAVFQSLLK